MKQRVIFAFFTAISSLAAFAQENDEVLQGFDDVLEYTEGYPQEPSTTNVKSIIFGLLFVFAFAWMIGHMVYVLWIRRDPFKTITIEEMKLMRAAEGESEEMSDEEFDTCRDILNSLNQSWTPIPGTDESIVTKHSQIKDAEIAMAQIMSYKPTDPQLVDAINEHLGVLQEAQKREFTGSKALMVILVLVAAFFIWQTGWSVLPFFIFNAVTYVLASLTPTFMLVRRELKGKSNSGGCLTAILGGAAAMILGAQTIRTVTKWSDGSTTTEDDHSQHLIAWVLAIVIALFLAFFMFVWAVVNYLRNYVFFR